MSLGTTLAWAYECYEEGLISEKDTNGLKLSWGNSDPVFELIKQVAYREGFGELISEGVRKAAQIIGRGSEKYALHSKGLEAICSDPRVAQGRGLSYAVSSRGYDHLRAEPFEAALSNDEARELFGTEEALDRFSLGGKGKSIKWFEDLRAIDDSLIVCKWSLGYFLAVHPKLTIEMLNSVTGLDFDVEGIFKIGERINHVEKAFNIREGLSRKDDTMPKRHLKEPIPEGPSKGHVLNLDPLLDQYYEARGWDVRTGLVPKTKLKELGLDEIAKELESLGKLPG
jgi:aldehyde:ferredoxin oxidoreductase